MVLFSSSPEHGIYYYDWHTDTVYFHKYRKKSAENMVLPFAYLGLLVYATVIVLGLKYKFTVIQWIIICAVLGVMLLGIKYKYNRKFYSAVKKNDKILLSMADKGQLTHLLRISKRMAFPAERLYALGIELLAFMPIWIITYALWNMIDLSTFVAILIPSLELSVYILYFTHSRKRTQCVKRIRDLLKRYK